MKTTALTATILLLCFSAVGIHAQDAAAQPADSSRVEKKIDRMSGKIDDLHRVVVESPLGDRKWGVEVDPVLLIFANNDLLLSGTVSNFSLDRSAEIAFPILYERLNNSSSYALTVDAHYRYFLGETQKGFYLAGYARYQHAHYRDVIDDIFVSDSAQTYTVNRLGVAFELGGRIFSRQGLYWGWSVSLGKYVAGNTPQGNIPDLITMFGGSDFIFDLELMKIGFAF